MSPHKALSLIFDDLDTLHAAWMPQFEQGGIFVPTAERYALGDRIYLLLRLPDETERTPVSGVVAWVSPPGVSGRRTAGIGVHFDVAEHALRLRIERLLDGLGTPSRSGYTF
ncbi:PilZ domain-containing protein [Kushneria phosphatilytica]|uniref:Pilus assembly protein PilZ n=1 Tax=Kushneria phosphatilytica TaxID=657387 RepID=A0A1S1NZM6_9GAMM|nr:PilZ domain-containing protein [Kushneria phosphatilytica]OHV12333.1 pilus assembly protein PilZ [Kushneria phosphatilytica]QEL10976.1 pilus assembly protein PilZ [Kushneria phosphatilytica]